MDDFRAGQPIFLQIRERLVEMILRSSVREGEALPSVRQISADMSVNPLTVSRAFDMLVEIGVVEKRRGRGMFVCQNARELLLAHEREKFLNEEWPRIAARIAALGIEPRALLEEDAPAHRGERQK